MVTPAPNTDMRLAASGHAAPEAAGLVAFLGRTSTLELQDPRASLRRQARSAQDWLPAGFQIVAWYWDVESGGLDLEDRSQTESWRQVTGTGIPRDGGMARAADKVVSAVQMVPRGDRRDAGGGHSRPGSGGGRVR